MSNETKAPFPHCDELVLHAPNSCRYCDHYPEKQQIRILNNINFTGETDPLKTPCPATQRRPLAIINNWGGNVAKPEGTEVEPDWEAADKQLMNLGTKLSFNEIYAWQQSIFRKQLPEHVEAVITWLITHVQKETCRPGNYQPKPTKEAVFDAIMDYANGRYAYRKHKQSPYMGVITPEIKSDQLQAAIEALIEVCGLTVK